MLCTRPGGEVVAAFSDQLQREVWTEAVDLGDVLSEQREKRRANVEGQCVRLIGSGADLDGGNESGLATAIDAEFLQHGFDPDVAGRCLLVVNVIEGEGLLERKQVLGAVGTGERLLDRLSAGVATVIAQAGQHLGVTLAGEDSGAARRQASGFWLSAVVLKPEA